MLRARNYVARAKQLGIALPAITASVMSTADRIDAAVHASLRREAGGEYRVNALHWCVGCTCACETPTPQPRLPRTFHTRVMNMAIALTSTRGPDLP